jgi:outer membrane protein assembly factor BamD
MNRPVPEPTQEAVAENDAEERSHQPLKFTDKTLGMIKHGPLVVEAAHVGDPTMTSPKRVIAPDITRENQTIFTAAFKAGMPASATTPAPAPTPTTSGEPPRSDRPQAPLTFENVPGDSGNGSGGNGIGATILSAPNAPARPADDPNAPVKPVASSETVLPAAEAPAAAPEQVNDIKPGQVPAPTAPPNAKASKKKPKLDESDESSSKKKKKKGLAKINPF